MPDLGDCRSTRFPALPQLGQERRVVHGVATKSALAKFVSTAECLDIGEQVLHSRQLMRRICPSRQVLTDGFIRKLCRTYPSWDTDDMAGVSLDIERIKSVLREATEASGKFSQRSLSKAAEESRDCVGDIINDRNKNPTTKVLANLARALGGDLSMFGLAEERADPPTEVELEAALRDMLPGMPRGSLDRRVRYLTEGVGRALRLPLDQSATREDRQPTSPGEGAPPPAPTN